MNRRKFVAIGAAGLASLHTLAAARAQSSVVFESKTTGAIVDFSATGYEFVDHKVSTSSDGGESERMEVRSDLGTLIIQFTNWVPRVQAEDMHDLALEFLHGTFGQANIEELGMQHLEDGAWMAYRSESSQHGTMLWYTEFQISAFPDVDLVIEFSTSEENLQAAFEEAQNVQLAGMPPFLFMEESGITDTLFERTASGTGFDRLTLPDRGGRDTNSTQTQSAGNEDDVIQAVREHQQQFRDELALFNDALVAITDETTTGSAEMDSITDVMDVMFSWPTYPETAAHLSFPAELAELEVVYFEWADGIGNLGTTMGQWLLSEGEMDPFITAMEVALDLDRKLDTALAAIGVAPAADQTVRLGSLIDRLRASDHRIKAIGAA